MEGIGGKLRAARVQWQLTLREVEDRSGRLAEQWGNPAYKISASWLDRVEREDGGLSATKLIVLAVIYGLSAEQMLGMCTPANVDPAQFEQSSRPNATMLLMKGALEEHAKLWLPDKLVTDPPPQDTMLLPAEQAVVPAHYRRGIIGQRDRTMEPMMKAGSIVLIDTQKRAIANRREWTNEFDRPIYFLMTHKGYVSGWCELDKDADWLTVVPHPLSFESSRRWRYRKEIEVIGTVAAMFMRRIA